MERYFGSFSSAEDIENQWAGKGALSGATVIAAIYTNENYSGDAMIVFRRDGKLYEVHDSHCSCNDLGNWCPEETTYEALTDRLDKTTSYDNEYYGAEFTAALRRGLIDEMFDREVLEN